MDSNLTIFDGKKVRRFWSKKENKWYFSLVDIVQILTESRNPTDYLKKLRKRDSDLGNYIGTNCPQVEMLTATGRKRETLAGNTEQLFRVIQSIPSPKAEPIKIWLARVGYERVEEINDPEKTLNRSRDYWLRLGRSAEWIQQRMMGQEIRNKLTDYWQEHEISKQEEFSILTNLIHEEWSGVNIKTHKKIKKLKSQNLRDHMTEAELIFTALAEMSTRQIAESANATGLPENKIAGQKGGGIAKKARVELEQKTGKKIVTGQNFLPKTDKMLKAK